MESNRLEYLPSELGQCSRLRILRLQNNRLRELPTEIGELRLLEEAYLDGNRLRQLPASLFRLPELRVVTAARNDLRDLPSEVADCTKLAEMDVSENNPLLDEVVPVPAQQACRMVQWACRRRRRHQLDIARVRAANAELEALVRTYDVERVALREEISRLRAERREFLEERPDTYLACKQWMCGCVIS